MDGDLDAILTAAAAGDESAWRRLVERYAGRIYGLLVRQCGDRELADEITQATFVKLPNVRLPLCFRFRGWRRRKYRRRGIAYRCFRSKGCWWASRRTNGFSTASSSNRS